MKEKNERIEAIKAMSRFFRWWVASLLLILFPVWEYLCSTKSQAAENKAPPETPKSPGAELWEINGVLTIPLLLEVLYNPLFLLGLAFSEQVEFY